MNDAPRPDVRVGPVHYQILSGAGLLLVFFAQLDQGALWGNLAIGCCGLLSLVSSGFMARITTFALLIFFALGQMQVHWDQYRRFDIDELRPLLSLRDLVLAIGLVSFMTASFRRQSLTSSILPADPRQREAKPRRKGRWRWREFTTVQPKRASRLLTPQEIARFVLILPLAALAGQGLWLLIARPWMVVVFQERTHRLIMLAWLLVLGLLITATILAHWRRRQMDPTAAAVYLQDVQWRETRREQRRIFRWLAWRRLHERAENQNPT